MTSNQEKFEIFNCDLCGSGDSVEAPHLREYTKDQPPPHICKNCGLVYIKERRSAQDIADIWSDELFETIYTARIPAMKARHVYIAEFLDVNIGLKDKNVCDIGAGEGQFLEILKKYYGANVFGIEPSKKNCQMLTNMDIPNFPGTIECYCNNPNAKNYQADIVTIMWTLENCRSCKDMLTAAHNILKPEGHVFVATGSRILVPFKKPLHFYITNDPADSHAYRFSANTLRGALAISGFKTTHINRYLDSDILCILGQKQKPGAQIEWRKDNYQEVSDYFERWHQDSKHFAHYDYNFIK